MTAGSCSSRTRPALVTASLPAGLYTQATLTDVLGPTQPLTTFAEKAGVIAITLGSAARRSRPSATYPPPTASSP